MIRISNIGTATRNNWILETHIGIIAVDTGLPGQSERFLKRFGKYWPVNELKYIFLTHAHIDHAGFLSELMQKTDARLILCEEASKVLAVGQNIEKHEYKNWLGRVLEKNMLGANGKYPIFSDLSRMDIVYDNDLFFKDVGVHADVVFLPGHTSDSIGLYLYENNSIICGDAAMNSPPFNRNRHTGLIEDLHLFHCSWDRMISLNADMIYPGHGKPFPSHDLVKYRHFKNSC